MHKVNHNYRLVCLDWETEQDSVMKFKICTVYYIDGVAVDHVPCEVSTCSILTESVNLVTLLDSIDIVQKLNGAFQMPLLFASSFPGKENPIKTEWKTLSETGGDWWDQEGTPFSPSVSDDWLNEIKTKTNNLSKDKLNNILNFDLNNLNFFNFGLTGEANKPTDQ